MKTTTLDVHRIRPIFRGGPVFWPLHARRSAPHAGSPPGSAAGDRVVRIPVWDPLLTLPPLDRWLPGCIRAAADAAPSAPGDPVSSAAADAPADAAPGAIGDPVGSTPADPAPGGADGPAGPADPAIPAADAPAGTLGADSRRAVVEAAKVFIEEHLGGPLDVTRISREAELSRPRFTRIFREVEGTTPWAYVLERRVRRAAELLERGRPPSEVALDTGFVDQSHLTRVFKRLTGTTPGEYRRRGTNVQDEDGAAA